MNIFVSCILLALSSHLAFQTVFWLKLKSLLKSSSHYLTFSNWQEKKKSREGKGRGEWENEGDMNHGIGLFSSCAPHLHIPMWKSCQEKEYTLRELSIVQSLQSHFSVHAHKHLINPTGIAYQVSQVYSLRKTKRCKSLTVILFSALWTEQCK